MERNIELNLTHRVFENFQYKDEILKSIESLIDSGRFINGPVLREFEGRLALRLNCKYSIGTSSGTSALIACLKYFNLSQDDEVIVPANTFIATALAVVHAGARPVFCDVDYETGNLSICDLKVKLNKKTKVIIPVHLNGLMVPLDELLMSIDSRKIRIIEDAAQAFGAYYLDNRTGKKIFPGNITDSAILSFYPTKNLGGIDDSGIILTNNEDQLSFYKSYIQYGNNGSDDYNIQGENYRMCDLSAAILNVKLDKTEELQGKRDLVAKIYLENIKNKNIKLPLIPDGFKHVFHNFVIKSNKRDIIVKKFEENQIPFGIHYPKPLYKYSNMASYFDSHCPVAERLAQEIISIPISPFLSDRQINFVIDVLNSI